MTNEQKAIIDKFFTKWGSVSEHSDETLRFYYDRPDTIIDTNRILYEDKKAAADIAALESMIETLKTLRVALAEQYNNLYQAKSDPVVRLKREKRSYENKVYYYLSTFRRYSDGRETTHETKKFSGSERSAAIQEYKTYVKQHPGIIAEMDIQKSRWE